MFDPATDLPEHWQAWLRAYRPRWNGSLSAYDFRLDEEVRLRFADGSEARFVAAFCAVDESRGELAVFTEHDRYHVFALGGLAWEGRVASLPEGAL